MRHGSFRQSCARKARVFVTHDSGATAVEYGLLAGLIALAIVAAMSSMSGAINNKFNTISTTITNAR